MKTWPTLFAVLSVGLVFTPSAAGAQALESAILWGAYQQSRKSARPWTDADEARSQRITFLYKNLDAFRGDLKDGGREHIAAYAHFRGCPAYTHGYFAKVIHAARETLLKQWDAMSLYQEIERTIAADTHLRETCGGTDRPVPNNYRVPAGLSVNLSLRKPQRAVVLQLKDLGGLPNGATAVLTSVLVAELSSVGNLKAIGPRDIDAMLKLEKMKDLVDCDATLCAAEIGGAFGSDIVIHGSIGRLGNQYLVVLNLIDSRESNVRGRIQRSMPADDDLLAGMVRDLVQEVVVRLDTPEEVLAPASGDK